MLEKIEASLLLDIMNNFTGPLFPEYFPRPNDHHGVMQKMPVGK